MSDFHHDHDEIVEAFAAPPFRHHVYRAQGSTVIEYFDDEVDEHRQIAMIRIRVHQRKSGEHGVEATGFWVHPDYRNRGIFTNAHKWAVTQPFSLISADTGEAEFYKEAGYKDAGDGTLVLDNRKTKKWLKGR